MKIYIETGYICTIFKHKFRWYVNIIRRIMSVSYTHLQCYCMALKLAFRQQNIWVEYRHWRQIVREGIDIRTELNIFLFLRSHCREQEKWAHLIGCQIAGFLRKFGNTSLLNTEKCRKTYKDVYKRQAVVQLIPQVTVTC